MTKDKLERFIWNLLHELYMASDPPLNFLFFLHEVVNNRKECEPDWFMKHKISEEKYNEIVKEAKKDKRFNRMEETTIEVALLNWGPTFKD